MEVITEEEDYDFTDEHEEIVVTRDFALKMLSFIQPRKGIPDEVEAVIVQKKQELYLPKLIGKKFLLKDIPEIKKLLEKQYLNSLMQPGETVGIICGQCIGEKTTQSSLSSFHATGLDTGATSQIDNLQNIINASKVKKKEIRKYFRTILYLKNPVKTLHEFNEKIRHYVEVITVEDLIVKMYKYPTTVNIPDVFKEGAPSPDAPFLLLQLNLQKLFQYRITRKILLQKLRENISEVHFSCVPYSYLEEDAQFLELFCFSAETLQVFEILKKIRETQVVGIEGIKSHILSQDNNKEWRVECICNSISIFLPYFDVYDLTRVMCNSVNDMYSLFGVLVADELIMQKCEEIVSDIDSAHFKILAKRMTKNGVVDPFSRYTMRSDKSPFTRASFEESFETLIEVCRNKEVEKFTSVSSAIICGKKAPVGTAFSDILVDPTFYNLPV